MLRSARIIAPRGVCAAHAVSARSVRPFLRTPMRYASGGEFPQLDEKALEKLMGNPLISKLIASPRAMEALKETTKVLSEKGYAGNMGVMKQVKLMMDKGVRTKMLELKQIMDEEGIELKQEDMQGLFEVMGWSGKK